MTQTSPTRECMDRSPRLHLSFELSWKSWKLGFATGGRKVRVRTICARDLAAVHDEIAGARRALRIPESTPVVSCYEAGRDGFWLHRALTAMGVQNVVVDPASLPVNRHARRSKTDRLDTRMLVRWLVRYSEGDRDVWSVVRVPGAEDEDARRNHRELECLKGECTAHSNRIVSLLALMGIASPTMARLPKVLDTLRRPDGQPLLAHLRGEILREWERWQLAHKQQLERERERDRAIRERSAEDAALQKVALMASARGIGTASATVLVRELFGWRTFGNRRELAGAVGLCGTPYNSGASEREQGISKQGNARVRSLLIQLAWGWLRHQPRSKLSRWYEERFGSGGSRQRRIGIVAVARKLLIDLWHLVEHGVVAEGMELSPI